MPAGRANLELVARTVGKVGYEDLPDAGRHQLPHRMRAAVPAIEVPDHAHPLRVRRPHGEMNASHPGNRKTMRAQLLPCAVMRAFAEKVEVEVGEDLAELIGVDDVARRRPFAYAEPVREVLDTPVEGYRRLEQPIGSTALHAEHPVVGDQ